MSDRIGERKSTFIGVADNIDYLIFSIQPSIQVGIMESSLFSYNDNNHLYSNVGNILIFPRRHSSEGRRLNKDQTFVLTIGASYHQQWLVSSTLIFVISLSYLSLRMNPTILFRPLWRPLDDLHDEPIFYNFHFLSNNIYIRRFNKRFGWPWDDVHGWRVVFWTYHLSSTFPRPRSEFWQIFRMKVNWI